MQKLRQEFKKSLSEMVAGSQSDEKEPIEGESTEPHSVSPMSVAFTPKTYCRFHKIVLGRRGGINTQ